MQNNDAATATATDACTVNKRPLNTHCNEISSCRTFLWLLKEKMGTLISYNTLSMLQ